MDKPVNLSANEIQYLRELIIKDLNSPDLPWWNQEVGKPLLKKLLPGKIDMIKAVRDFVKESAGITPGLKSVKDFVDTLYQ